MHSEVIALCCKNDETFFLQKPADLHNANCIEMNMKNPDLVGRWLSYSSVKKTLFSVSRHEILQVIIASKVNEKIINVPCPA